MLGIVYFVYIIAYLQFHTVYAKTKVKYYNTKVFTAISTYQSKSKKGNGEPKFCHSTHSKYLQEYGDQISVFRP